MGWDRFRKWFGSERSQPEPPEVSLRWYEPGPRNPFGIRLLDCKPVAWQMTATTSNPEVASKFVSLRSSDGADLVGATIPDSSLVPTSLTLPHDGSPLEGIVFKARAMEEKWDIYIYDSMFLFARSWTGDLFYRAKASVGENEIHISEVEGPAEEAAFAASAVYYLMATHAMNRVFPHPVPAELNWDSPMDIALWSFSRYGRLGCYAAKDDLTSIPLPQAKGE